MSLSSCLWCFLDVWSLKKKKVENSIFGSKKLVPYFFSYHSEWKQAISNDTSYDLFFIQKNYGGWHAHKNK
jgi:hypothetical protein